MRHALGICQRIEAPAPARSTTRKSPLNIRTAHFGE
jgi:hypothetical protein